MIRILILLALLAFAVRAAGAEDQPASARSPAELPAVAGDITLLFRLQDATAWGDRSALAAQKLLLADIANKLRAEPAERASRLAPFVIAYVLSGGEPERAEALAKSQGLDAGNKRLLEAAALFMRGDREAAAKALKDVDPLSLPSLVAGRIALMKALLAKDDSGAHQANLAEAAAALPGSLIEESALRRSALAYAQDHDEAAFWNRAERYQRRFPRSLYARAFWEEALTALANWSREGNGPDLPHLDIVLSRMPLPERRDLYLVLARRAAAANAEASVGFAASRLGRLAAPGSQEDQTARLYQALYRVASSESGTALREIETVHGELLPLPERALLAAARAIGRQVNRTGEDVVRPRTETPDTFPIISRGEQVLETTARLLAEAGS